ncbi:hypothetical protein BCR33DRAFT_554366 [Rhizoclosmatium globosum]|uniref:Uncharacterized protein n=1 Tax=Rhizoclosmatium globosum TaxID=329046 RepID=A0A1Y2CSI4_9FUNG|nr:hypothetical protein BCR33DRAFT_554366 [Rhizoclosmatium globosum]|eukprot:ORY49856.1 hypothetical protein BCR33DRAFT_554366 [Rhizoclosmatium globosum]
MILLVILAANWALPSGLHTLLFLDQSLQLQMRHLQRSNRRLRPWSIQSDSYRACYKGLVLSVRHGEIRRNKELLELNAALRAVYPPPTLNHIGHIFPSFMGI